jgi:hypothetical protein
VRVALGMPAAAESPETVGVGVVIVIIAPQESK